MRELHEPTCDYIIPFYYRAQRYINITATLLHKGVLDYDQACVKIRTELYSLHNKIFHHLLPLERKMARFTHQVQIAAQVLVFCLSTYCLILIIRYFY